MLKLVRRYFIKGAKREKRATERPMASFLNVFDVYVSIGRTIVFGDLHFTHYLLNIEHPVISFRFVESLSLRTGVSLVITVPFTLINFATSSSTRRK